MSHFSMDTSFKKMKLIILVVLFFVVVASTSETGPPGPVKLHQLTECDPPVNTLDAKLFINTASDNTDSLALTITLPNGFDENTLITVETEKFVNNQWEESSYGVDDVGLFEFINGFMPNIWNNFREQVQPKIEENDRVPPGTYKLENFQAKYQDITTPQVPYGRFMAKLQVTSNDELLYCFMTEIELSPPSTGKVN